MRRRDITEIHSLTIASSLGLASLPIITVSDLPKQTPNRSFFEVNCISPYFLTHVLPHFVQLRLNLARQSLRTEDTESSRQKLERRIASKFERPLHEMAHDHDQNFSTDASKAGQDLKFGD